ncbi:MAG: hypothetical protein RSB48_03450, partial [Akkermansia sp.]
MRTLFSSVLFEKFHSTILYLKRVKNPVFNTDINQFTNRPASGSGGNPGGPEPFNENPPAAP